MTKIFLNKSKLKYSYIPNLNDAVKHLNNAVYGVGDLDIPWGFEHATYLKNLGEKNSILLNELVSKKKNLDNIISKIKKAENNSYNNFSDISILNIYNRTGF